MEEANLRGQLRSVSMPVSHSVTSSIFRYLPLVSIYCNICLTIPICRYLCLATDLSLSLPPQQWAS